MGELCNNGMTKASQSVLPNASATVGGHYVSFGGAGHEQNLPAQDPEVGVANQVYYVPPQIPQPPPAAYVGKDPYGANRGGNHDQNAYMAHEEFPRVGRMGNQNEDEHPVAAFCLGFCLGSSLSLFALCFLMVIDSIFKSKGDKMRYVWGLCLALAIQTILGLLIVFLFIGVVSSAATTAVPQ